MSKLRNTWNKRRSKKRDPPGQEPLDENGEGDKDFVRKTSLERSNSASKLSKLRRSASAASPEILLHHAVAQENLNTFSKVIEADKLDLNFMRPPGVAPIHIACAVGNLKFVSMLAEKGADINLKTNVGLSPLRLAFIFGHFVVAEYLLSMGSDPNDIKDGFQYDSIECKQTFERKSDRGWKSS